MQDIVAWNQQAVREFIKNDSRWFKGWQDVPVHEHQPLRIRKPDSKDDLLSYASPWSKEEAAIAFEHAGTYQAAGNVFWIDPFSDASSPTMRDVAGDPPIWSTCLDAAESYSISKIHQEDVMQGNVSAAQEARIKFPHIFTVYALSLIHI